MAADRSAGVQGGQSGGDLGDLHLQHLADGDQHCGGRAARAAGLPQRRARAEPLRMEGLHADPVPRRAAVHADRRAPLDRRRVARDRRRRNADRRRRHRLLGVGRMEQPERRAHHHRDLRGRHRRPAARADAAAARPTVPLRMSDTPCRRHDWGR